MEEWLADHLHLPCTASHSREGQESQEKSSRTEAIDAILQPSSWHTGRALKMHLVLAEDLKSGTFLCERVSSVTLDNCGMPHNTSK